MKKKVLLACGIAALVLLFAAVNLYFGCPFRRLTGVPCPACGITRAGEALLRGDIAGAFRFNPLFPMAYILLIIFAVYLIMNICGALNKKREKIFAVIFSLIMLVFVVVWLVRLSLGLLL